MCWNDPSMFMLSRFAFDRLGANRGVIRCDAANSPSRQVAEACGYALEGRHRRDELTPSGDRGDPFVFAMLREEYEAALPGWRPFLAEG